MTTNNGPVLRQLLPPGPSFFAPDDSEFADLLDGLGESYDAVDLRSLALLEEFDPRTTTELLVDWERVYGLPGTNPSPPTSTAGRRAALWAKEMGGVSPTPAESVAIAAACGYVTTVISCPHNQPFVAGSPVGDALWNNTSGGWVWVWTVITDHGADDALLRWELEQQTPDHTYIDLVIRGTTFVEQAPTVAKNKLLKDVSYNNGTWIAVGQSDGADAYLLRSVDDGVTWTESANPKAYALNSVDHGDGAWVAVGERDGTDAYMIRSTDDGITWVEVANSAINKTLNGVRFDHGTWIAVGDKDGADAYLLRSTDAGATWTEIANPKEFQLDSVIYGKGIWIAAGAADGTDAYILRSVDDGLTWIEQANPKNFGLHTISFGLDLINGVEQFVAMGAADGVDAYLVTSPDGATWTERANPKNFALRAVTYVDGLWTAVGAADGTDAYIIGSFDCLTWVEWANPKNFLLYGIGSDRMSKLIAVGAADGTDPYMISTEVR